MPPCDELISEIQRTRLSALCVFERSLNREVEDSYAASYREGMAPSAGHMVSVQYKVKKKEVYNKIQ